MTMEFLKCPLGCANGACWKVCDQGLFVLTLILNPFEGLAAFRPQASMNHFECNRLFCIVSHRIPLPITCLMYQWQMYTQMILQHPTNTSSAVENAEHLKLVSLVFCHYLTSTGPFTKWPGEQAEYKISIGRFTFLYNHTLSHTFTGQWPYCCVEDVLRALGVLGCMH